MKRFVTILLLLFCSLCFHNAVITGTKNGLLLWYQTLIPALLPFLLITNALSETGSYHALSSHIGKPLSSRLYEWIAILLGNLCGYPSFYSVFISLLSFTIPSEFEVNQHHQKPSK